MTTETLQPRAQAYVDAHPGRPWVNHEYIVWISGRWSAWAAETGFDMDRPKTADDHVAFDAWLDPEAAA